MPKTQSKHSSRDLAPGALLSLLNDYHLLSFETIDSTNEEAKRIAIGGGSHGAVVWAKEQEEGKGRSGREWQSDDGNLFVSMLLRPGCDIEALSQLSYVAALAAYHTIEDVLGEDADIKLKWPNDLLVNDKKVAGILLESFTIPGDDERWAVVGLGMNIESSPSDVRFPATSLKEEGVEIISAKIVLSRYVHCFIENYNQWSRRGFSAIRRQWQQAAWALKEQVTVQVGNDEIRGEFRGVDAEGGLIIQQSAKERLIVHAGDMFALADK